MLATKEDMEMLQKNLKTLRFIFGMDYKDIAEYMGLSAKTVQRIETGKSKMNRPYYYAIWECFHDREMDLSDDVTSSVWYNKMFTLFTQKGTDLWEKRRKHIEGVVWIFQMRYKKKPEYNRIRLDLYYLLKDLYTRPLYFSK